MKFHAFIVGGCLLASQALSAGNYYCETCERDNLIAARDRYQREQFDRRDGGISVGAGLDGVLPYGYVDVGGRRDRPYYYGDDFYYYDDYSYNPYLGDGRWGYEDYNQPYYYQDRRYWAPQGDLRRDFNRDLRNRDLRNRDLRGGRDIRGGRDFRTSRDIDIKTEREFRGGGADRRATQRDTQRQKDRSRQQQPMTKDQKLVSYADTSDMDITDDRNPQQFRREMQQRMQDRMDQRNAQHIDDHDILNQIRNSLENNYFSENFKEVDVTVWDGDVMLRGRVDDEGDRRTVKERVAAIPGTGDIIDRLDVMKRDDQNKPAPRDRTDTK